MKQNFEKLVNHPHNERKAILIDIDRLKIRLKQARNKLMEEVIDDEDYFEIKAECKRQIEKLEAQLTKGKEK